jgi:hypothetical protein
VWCGFGEISAVVSKAASAHDLIGGTILWAIVYIGVLLALWVTSGRPNGAETVFLTVFKDALCRFTRGRTQRRA